MLAITHALIGASIAKTIPDPAIGGALCITSHFIIDSIPHWDFGTHWRNRPKKFTGIISIADTLIAITLAYLLFAGKVSTPYLLFAIILSLLPDWMETPWYIFFAQSNKHTPAKSAGFFEKLTFRIYRLENTFHAKAEFPLGFVTQIITLAFFLLLLK